MPDKDEKERRKQLKKELREQARIKFEESLPIERELFLKLFDFLDEKLSSTECDDSLLLTNLFIEEHRLENVTEIKNWLNDNGGYCDCEVLYNVEEKFEEDAIL